MANRFAELSRSIARERGFAKLSCNMSQKSFMCLCFEAKTP